MNNLIKIDNIFYNVYEVLGLHKDSSDRDIKIAFNKRVKRYHPDKCSIEKRDEYTKKYNIVVKAYDYIISNRKSIKNIKKIDVDEFNKKFDRKEDNNNGYGEHSKINSVDEYQDLDIKIEKQIDSKNFNNKEFNKLFDYLNIKDENEESMSLYKTNDNFYGYNNSNHMNVHSYNGLMVYGDENGLNGCGYWSKNYSDYKAIYKQPKKKLDKKIVVPENFTNEVEVIDRDYNEYKKEYTTFDNVVNYHSDIDKMEMYDLRTLKRLEEEEEESKNFIIKYNKFSDKVLESGLNGELDRSESYLNILKKDLKRINN